MPKTLAGHGEAATAVVSRAMVTEVAETESATTTSPASGSQDVLSRLQSKPLGKEHRAALLEMRSEMLRKKERRIVKEGEETTMEDDSSSS